MSRRNPEKIVDLSTLIDSYKNSKDSENEYKKLSKDLGDQIKNEFASRKIDKFASDKYVATVSITQKESINQDRAIIILKDNLSDDQLDQVVKTKEYIDEDALEKLIYNGEVQADLLASAIEKGKPTSTLRIKDKK
jgi:hypothetical protein